ncbi:MAG: minichromosome maintenance protein MCM [Candidatus Micrarchaeota archaeon]|nr:minichromosome maintenance protein MCM [Candidatus Micrarchaeota archaeon]
MEQVVVAEDAVGKFEEFFSSKLELQILELATAYPEKRSLEVDFGALEKFNPDLADALLASPDENVRASEQAIGRRNAPTSSGKKFSPHVRFFNLPEAKDVNVDVQHLGAEHLNHLVRVEGVISWITDIKPLMKTALWECMHCEATIKTSTEKSAVRVPAVCKCGRKDFRLVEESSDFLNIQRAQMQEPVEKLRGNVPTSQIQLWIEDDLTNEVAPGEKFVVTGILRLKPSEKGGKGKNSVYEKLLDVHHLHRSEREFEDLMVTKDEEKALQELAKNPRIFEMIIKSIAPSIYGHDELKEAIALQLFGGTPDKVLPDGQRIRSDLHLLLIGDPGVAKSSILEYVSRLAPKCVYVSGGSASGVGLTASAEKDSDGEGWILKAGAMVLASGGLACIDEFDKMDESDRGAIHQAMEQQVISIAKAGIVTQFKARTSVLAAANPKLGRFDPNEPPANQFNISPALLSRFDLIFAMRDDLDEARDAKMADHILMGHRLASEKRIPVKGEKGEAILPVIAGDLLRKYISYARKTAYPILTNEAAEKIKDYYAELRRLGAKQNTFPITPRQIEGIVRLAEASAKLRLNAKVELQDAERAIGLYDHVLKSIFVDRETGNLDSDIISIGQPKSRLDKVRSIMGIIGAMEKQVDAVEIEEVVKEAVRSHGMEEHYARHLVEELRRQGDLYSPKPGHVKTARGKSW